MPKWIYVSVAIVFASFLIYYFLLSALASLRWVENANQVYASNISSKTPADPSLFFDSAFISMQKQISNIKAKLKMAEDDSIGLSINLADSSANLEITGVRVHTARINSFKVSRAIRGMEHQALANLLSQPFIISESVSTIAKEPILVKKAPRDSIEAAQTDIIPDSSTIVPVFYSLNFSNGIRLVVLQDIDQSNTGSLNRFWFLLKYRYAQTTNALKDVIRFRVPAYFPTIRITISEADAKIIYRALPVKGNVVIFL